MINNRQNGRRRGRGGGQRQGGGGQGQRDSGNRIDSRARGNAAQLLEKYKNMARDAQMAGDRVNTEYYLQFADHYFRVLADQRGRSDDQQPVRRQRDDFDQFDDGDDFGDEGEPIRAEEQGRAIEAEAPSRRERFRDDRPRADRPRDDRPRDDRPRAERQHRDARPDVDADAAAVVNGGGTDHDLPASALAGDEEAPRRRRTRKPREEAPVSADAESASFEADRLPPALGIAASAEADAPKPRRRRVRTAGAEAATAE